MKNIFLLSKHLADRSEQIEVSHIKEAVKSLNIIDEDAKKMFKRHLKIRTFKEASYTQNEIEEAEKKPKKSFSEEVKALKKIFEAEGYSLLKKVSELKEVESILEPFNVDDELLEEEKSNSSNENDEVLFDLDQMPNLFKRIKNEIQLLKKNLLENIYDQDQAVEAICDNIMESSYHEGGNGPKAIFFFLGPPATGKTYLTQLMQQYIDGYTATKVFDMTQYTHEESGGGLYGTGRMWGNAAPGQLTSFVRENPKSIIVFDEFEKSNTKVQSNLLSILSAGYLDDACGWCSDGKPYTTDRKDEYECSGKPFEERVDFTQTMIVFTSNLGKEMYGKQTFMDQMKTDPHSAQSMILEAVSREKKLEKGYEVPAITPEMLSRISQGEIILFNKLSLDSFERIARNQINSIKEKFQKTFLIDIFMQNYDLLVSTLVLSFAPNIDTRRLKSKLHLSIFDKLTDYLLHESAEIRSINIMLDEKSQVFVQDKIKSLNKEQKDKFLRDLFRKNETFVYDEAFEVKDDVLILHLTNLRKQKLPKAKDFEEEGGLVFDIPKLSFKDIAGHKVAKERLNEVISFLKNPERLKDFDTNPPKGMLLYGPPGTGKTMLAQAFASEADLPFISTTGVDLLGTRRTNDGKEVNKIDELFKRAQEYAPSIVFIDEIDSLGSRTNGGYIESINKLLTSLNGFSNEPDEMVFVIAATNHKERIDSAIIRPGRIGLHVMIDQLDKEARRYFIEKILKKPTQGDFDIDRLTTFTAGMTGAELDKIGRESALYVIRNGLEAITQEIIVEQINTLKYGEKLDIDSLEILMESTAFHEAAHAVLTYILLPERQIEQITVVPRKNALGFVSYNVEDDVGNLTREKIRSMICITMAGREAQLYKYGEVGMDSGASNDLLQATSYAHYAVANLGMDEEIGYVNTSGASILSAEIDKRVQVWLKEGQEATQALVKKFWKEIEIIAKALIEDEMLTEKQFKALLK